MLRFWFRYWLFDVVPNVVYFLHYKRVLGTYYVSDNILPRLVLFFERFGIPVPFRVTVYFPYEPETGKRIELLAKQEKGECLGSGCLLRSMESDIEFTFPSMQHAQAFSYILNQAFPQPDVLWFPFHYNLDFINEKHAIWRDWKTT